MYKCPVCQQPLIKNDRSFICINHHSFDISKYGYVHLFPSNKSNHGDNDLLIKARKAFLSNEHYQPLLLKLIDIIDQLSPNSLIDLGCGEGYYTNHLNQIEHVIGVDLSKRALQYAAKNSNKQTHQYLLASIFDVPLQDHLMDVALLIFAPYPENEVKRLLKEKGYFIEVSPGPLHLYELKQVLYDQVLENPITLREDLSLIDFHEVTFMMNLCKEDIHHLFEMTPYRYKTSSLGMQKLYDLHSLKVKAQFHIRIYSSVSETK
ncbi:MAG: methyltransferase domain-containing protein [Erysipelotrichaceae bacterium]